MGMDARVWWKQDKGNSWQSLMSRQSGPRAEAKASDWLSTAVATSSSKGSKTKYARAQLEAALSQVPSHRLLLFALLVFPCCQRARPLPSLVSPLASL